LDAFLVRAEDSTMTTSAHRLSDPGVGHPPAPRDAVSVQSDAVELTVLMPCLNEERTIGACIRKAQGFMAAHGIAGEVLVVDNGSSDRSGAIAAEAGARVVRHEPRGYGSALRHGIREARGTFVVMGDADDTYDFGRLDAFVQFLRSGNDLVMGSRLRGDIGKGAMPWMHRHVGTPVLTALMNLFYRTGISDTNCGLRGFRRKAVEGLDLRCNGMEFASEMVIRASQEGLRIAETPIAYAAPSAARKPHLNTFRDGWRHLRFMLVLSPTWLFLYPGLAVFLAGFALMGLLMVRAVAVMGIPLGLSAVLFAGMLMFIGLQATLFGVFGVLLSGRDAHHAHTARPARLFVRWFTVERGLLAGAIVACLGLVLGAITVRWLLSVTTPSSIHAGVTRLSIVSTFVTLLGIQITSFSFFLGLADLDRTLE
jgi:glycosyltransferase involved in cell wall biosynthesis